MTGFKTYTGLLVALIGTICQVFKLNLTTEDIQPIVNMALELGGLLFAAYGRLVAKPK